jgi:hypothetical protein
MYAGITLIAIERKPISDSAGINVWYGTVAMLHVL